MKCYNHHDRDAFGICTVCDKGLCLECMNDKNSVITCNDKKCINRIKRIKLWRTFLYIVLVALLLFLIFD